jgi:hypothetical protein
MSKNVRIMGLILLTLLGAGYFTAFSNLEVPLPWFRAIAALVPVQLGTLAYFWYRYRFKPEKAQTSLDSSLDGDKMDAPPPPLD